MGIYVLTGAEGKGSIASNEPFTNMHAQSAPPYEIDRPKSNDKLKYSNERSPNAK